MKKTSFNVEDFECEIYKAEKDRLSFINNLEECTILKTLELVSNKKMDTILDIGCGTGEITLLIAKYFKNTKVVGIDKEERFIIENQKKYSEIKNLTFINCDFFDLKINNNTVDMCYCKYIFQHLRNPNELLLELKRVLKPEGKIAILDINSDNNIFYPEPINIKKIKEAEQKYKKIIKNDINIAKKIYTFLCENGFRNIRVMDTSLNNINFDRKKITEMLKLWNFLEYSKHPYVVTKMVTELELKNYTEDLIKISEAEDSYISISSLFFVGEK